MSDSSIDLAAAARIARRVDLKDIRLTSLSGTRTAVSGGKNTLVPRYEHDCKPLTVSSELIEVSCDYRFKVFAADAELAAVGLTYHLTYELRGEEPTDEADVLQFAQANGAYHSWPFAREAIYGLTAKMGFPPYTLPVLSLAPRRKPESTADSAESDES